MQQKMEFPIQLKWNLDPGETESFRVVASLGSRQLELAGQASTVSFSSVQLAVRGGEFRNLHEKTAGLTLLNVPVAARNRQGHQEVVLQMKIDDAIVFSLPDGVYRGWVTLSAQQQNYDLQLTGSRR